MSPSGILRASGGYRVLEHESDFLVLCALPLGRFLAAAVIGFGVKAYLYSSVIHHALEAAEPADLLRAEAMWPLIALALALFAARALRRRWGRLPPDRPRSD